MSRSKTLLQTIKPKKVANQALDNYYEKLERENIQRIHKLSKQLKISNLFSCQSSFKNNSPSINIFGGFQRAMFLTLVYRCSSDKPHVDIRGRKQFHKVKSLYKDSHNTKQHTQSKEELASALISLENPIFQLFGDTPRFSSIHSKSKPAISISNNYRKGQQSKMVLNSGEVFYIRNQVICKLSYRQLSQEKTSLFLTSFNFVSHLSLINIFGANSYCAKHEVAR